MTDSVIVLGIRKGGGGEEGEEVRLLFKAETVRAGVGVCVCVCVCVWRGVGCVCVGG